MGILLLLALAGVAVALAASQKPKATASIPATPLTTDQTSQIAAYAQIPPAMVPTFVAAIRSGDPRVASSTAAWFRAQGYNRAADLLTAAAESVPKPAVATPSAAAPNVVAVPAVPPTPAASSPTTPPTSSPSAMPAPVAGSSGASPVPPFVPPAIVLPGAELQPTAAVPATNPLTAPAAIAVPVPPAAVPGTAPLPTGQDPPLPHNIRTLLESVLRTAHDPAVIYQAADMLQVAGFPNTAAELRKRAVAIASSQVDPIAIIQDILQHAEQGKPPPTAPTSPSIPGSSLPQNPAPSPTTPSNTVPISSPPWSAPGTSAPGATPSGTAATPPTQAPAISVTIPTQITVPPIPGITMPPGTVPQVPAPPTGTRFYVVESGDNPSKIAKKFTGDSNR